MYSSGYTRPSSPSPRPVSSQPHERRCHRGLVYLFPHSPIEESQDGRLTNVWRAKVQLPPVRFGLYQSRTWYEIGNIGVGLV